MRKIMLLRAGLLAASLLTVGAPSSASSRNNGANGYADQSLIVAPVGVPSGAVLVPFAGQYHSALVTRSGRIWDVDLANLINESWLLPLDTGYAQLNIHMAQCFGGGFIDELDHGTTLFPGAIPRLSINTAARWDKKSIGVEGADPRNRYSFAWWFEQDAGIANKAMLNAYTTALSNQTYPAAVRAAELPQYFSAPDAQDASLLGSGPDKKVALLFVGDDRDRTAAGIVRNQRHYRDALRMYGTLRNNFGFAAADIRVYYHDGTAPAGAPAGLPIDGAATEANFNAFFAAPPQPIAGGNDEIFIWTSDHGALRFALAGQVQLLPDAGVQLARLDFQLTPEYLTALNTTDFDPQLFGLPRLDIATLNNPGNAPVSVLLNGHALGVARLAGDGFDLDPAWLSSSNTLSFQTSGGGSVVVGDLSLSFVAPNEIGPVPEPASAWLLGPGLLLVFSFAGRRGR
ncbi:hypothetical protein [Roseateles violae]|uniref:PEP-CTERM protein-sorting domain-containing protein n=1 Tax=Roseateles violae TaxID=3058042 RepID=A0ABT8DUS9_9BURK|nr:hypothetical protein [Pelomonas sp. PFR6]MDN3922076.1 hypothetical protein [Pelomonas sp. PFR6]